MKFLALPRLLLFLFGCLLLAPAAHAQLQVGISLHRSLYIRYEPIIATVTITNLSGRPLVLSDQSDTPWFGFQIESKSDNGNRPVSPRMSSFPKDTVAIGPGETLRRQVNITPLYVLDDFGRYSIRANVFESEQNRYYSSPSAPFEITEGRLLWEENVGLPLDGSPRRISLLAHRLPNSTSLYLRIINPDAGRVFCTHKLGDLMSYGKPDVELDTNNEVHILQLRAPRNFVYSHIGLNGEIRVRKAYDQTTESKPTLRRGPNGEVLVVGGREVDPAAKAAEAQAPGVSDRPVPLPSSGQTQQKPAFSSVPSASPTPKGGLNLWPFKKKP